MTSNSSISSHASGAVLWVDDHPENNTREVNALSGFGFNVTQVHSTRQALVQLAARSFTAVISDMGRWEGPQEGYVLLEELRRSDLHTPLFFYAGSAEPEHVAESKRRGAQGCTNDMQYLILWVREAAKRGA